MMMFTEKDLDLLKFGVASLLFGNDPIDSFDLVYDCEELPVSLEDRKAIGQKCLDLNKAGADDLVVGALNVVIPLVKERTEEYLNFGGYLLSCDIESLYFTSVADKDVFDKYRTLNVTYYNLYCKATNNSLIGTLAIFPSEQYMIFTYVK